MHIRAPHRRRWLLAFGVALSGLAPALVEAQQSWTSLATLSPTTTLSAGHVCATDGRDIYCDSSTPLLTGLGSLDRIVSGTAGVYVSSTGIISLRTGGVTTGYFDASGLLVAPGISVTTAHGVSSTRGYFSGNVGIGLQPSAATPLIIQKGTGALLSGFNQLLTLTGTGLDDGGNPVNSVGQLGFAEGWDSSDVANQGGALAFRQIATDDNGLTTSDYLFQGLDANQNVWIRNGKLGVGTTNSPQTKLDVSGTIKIANSGEACDGTRAGAVRWNGSQFQVCYGSGGWALLSSAATSGSANTDRITSGTTSAVANSGTTYISLTTGGTTWGYLSSGTSYVPRVGTTHVSTTTASATSLQLVSPTTVFTCNSTTAGTMRYNSPTTTLELCTGSGWQPMGVGIPAGTISAFASTTCPVGWSEYTAARGRFLRGIDNGAGVDPSGTRSPGTTQEDDFKGHNHAALASGASVINSGAGNIAAGAAIGADTGQNMTGSRGGAETRPKNVAVTFCQFNGTSNGWNNPLSGGNTTAAGSTGQIQYNTANAFDASSGLTWTNAQNLLTVGGTVSTTSITVGGRTLEQYIASNTSAGTIRLASLTDVSLSNVTGLDILRFNGTSWTNVNVQNVISTTTMQAGWPDVILCGNAGATSDQIPVYFGGIISAGRAYYYYVGSSAFYIIFNADGTVNASQNLSGSGPYACTNQTVTSLYAAGRAYNLIGGSGTVTPSVDNINSGTTRVTVNSDTSTVSITTAGTTTAYFTNVGRLVLPGISATTNASSFTTGYFSGNVGVRNASPLVALDVNGVIRSTAGSGLILNPSAGEGGQLVFGYAGGPTITGESSSTWNVDVMSDNMFRIFRRNTTNTALTALVISETSGNVGIGNGSSPQTALHVYGTLRLGDGGEACDANRAGAIRYTSASTFQTCNGGGAWQAIGTGTSTSRLASLTDVSLSNVTGLDILRFNGTSWTNVNVQNAISTTTMVAGWPDAIRCDVSSNGERIFRLMGAPTGGSTYVYRETEGGTVDLRVVFNTGGTITQFEYGGSGSTSTSCGVGQTIGALYGAGRAYNFIGGSGTVTPSVDRITSGTTSVIANSATTYISLSTGGTTWGYLSSGTSYLPRVGTTHVSTTTASATSLQLISPTTVFTCNATTAGTMRYNSPTTTLELCTGSGWQPMGVGIPAGTISAFASTTCPTGWSEYTAARGRFLRGIDNGAGNDPAGTRSPGATQADAIQDHSHRARYATQGGSGLYIDYITQAQSGAGSLYTANVGGMTAEGANVATETRPKNVAVIFCQFNGTSNGWNNPLSGGSTIAAGSTGQIQYNTGNSFDASAGLTWTNAQNLLTVGGTVSTTSITVGGRTLEQYIASNTSAGTTRLASLTDVSLSNVTGLDILRFNGTSWTNVNVQNAISTTTVQAGWPDAIACYWSGGPATITLFRQSFNHSTGAQTYVYADANTTYTVNYASGGAYSSHNNLSVYDCVGSAYSISQLYSMGRAYNFIGGSGTVTPSVDRITSSTTAAVIANQSGGTVSFTLSSTPGAAYLHPTLGLVAPGVSTTGNVSATRVGVASSDSAGAPGYTWVGDTNTGIFQPAADTLGFSTGGTERARLTSIGISSTGLYVAGDISYTGVITDVSDRRLKDKIAKLPYSRMLERMMLLQPVQFEMKDRPGLTEYGFVAQELQKVFPDLVFTSNDPQKTLSLNMTGLIAPMVQAMQELKRENDSLKAKVDGLEQRLQRLERMIETGGRTVH